MGLEDIDGMDTDNSGPSELDWFHELRDSDVERTSASTRRIRDDEVDLTIEDIPVPDIDPDEYEKIERCAYLLRRLREAGMERRMNKTEISDMFDVQIATINRDLDDYVFPHVKEKIGKNHLSRTENIMSKVMEELIDDGNYKEARKAVDSWNEWMSDRGIAEKEPEKIKQVHGITEEDKEKLDELF